MPLSGSESVTKAADGLEVFCRGAKFCAEPAHVGVNGAGAGVLFVTTGILEQAVSRLDAPLACKKQAQQLEFNRREVHWLITDLYHMAAAIDKHVSNFDHFFISAQRL